MPEVVVPTVVSVVACVTSLAEVLSGSAISRLLSSRFHLVLIRKKEFPPLEQAKRGK
jgi:hypothetical protein